MSEGRRAVHPREPAVGAEEDVEAPGTEYELDAPGAGRPDNAAHLSYSPGKSDGIRSLAEGRRPTEKTAPEREGRGR